MEIAAGAYYTVETFELPRWQSDSTVLSDIGSGILLVNDGSIDITDVNSAINHLKDIGPKQVEITSPFTNTGGFFARLTGIEGVATFGTTTAIDYILTEERYINGVRLLTKGAAWGDYIKFQVVHPVYGVLNEFGTKWYIDADNAKQEDVLVPYPARLPAGLTVRILYTSVGTENITVYANLYLHKKV